MKVNPGDLVEVHPGFLDESPGAGGSPIGVIIRESVWDDGYLTQDNPPEPDKWWVVLRGDILVHHPRDTFEVIG